MRLSAMKQVNSNHHALTKCAMATLTITITPARTRIKESDFIFE
jgi:hypothetical protein